jgi:hypothetical protein
VIENPLVIGLLTATSDLPLKRRLEKSASEWMYIEVHLPEDEGLTSRRIQLPISATLSLPSSKTSETLEL